MGKVIRVAPEDAPYVSATEYVAASPASSTERDAPEQTLATQALRTYFAGTDHSLALVETRATADKPAVPHAHAVDEIIYVLEGELIIGRRTYGPESAIYIPAYTLYSFRVGSNGVRYLNFRAQADHSYITKERFMSQRRERTSVDIESEHGLAESG